MSNRTKILRLSLHRDKAVQAVDYVAQKWPGVTQYYVCKIMYFADKEHCLDWGRTITGDRYVAMDHGPVPSRIYEMLKPASGEEDELLDALSARLHFSLEGNKIHLYSGGTTDFPALAQSDVEHLDRAIEFCKPLSFGQLREVSHDELAWSRATTDEIRNNPPMDLADWFEAEHIDRAHGASELLENAKFGVG
jgi:uncharacterized phage-associated protein